MTSVLTPDMRRFRNELRFVRYATDPKRPAGAIVERDHEDEWDVWPVTSRDWRDAVECETAAATCSTDEWASLAWERQRPVRSTA